MGKSVSVGESLQSRENLKEQQKKGHLSSLLGATNSCLVQHVAATQHVQACECGEVVSKPASE